MLQRTHLFLTTPNYRSLQYRMIRFHSVSLRYCLKKSDCHVYWFQDSRPLDDVHHWHNKAVLTALLGPYLDVCLVIVLKLTEITSAPSKSKCSKHIETSAAHQGPHQPLKTFVDQTRIQLTCQGRKNSFFGLTCSLQIVYHIN